MHQENSTLLEWLEPVSPVAPARQHISWIYVDMPESSMRAGRENCWYQSPRTRPSTQYWYKFIEIPFLSFAFMDTAGK